MLGALAPYSKMKNGVEDAIRDLGFEQAIVLRPGALLGDRDQHRAGDGIMQFTFRSLDYIGLKDKLSVEGVEVGRAAATALKMAEEGKAPSKYWTVEQPDIIRLGRTEWKGDNGVDEKAAETDAA